jgi:hypothetical protein
MKSTFATFTTFTAFTALATAIALAAGFTSLSASANEAPEFRSAPSTLTRMEVSSAIMGTGRTSEATIIPVSKSVLSRAEVAKQAFEVNKAGPRGTNELSASNLN